MKHAIILMGLPLAGKTTWLVEQRNSGALSEFFEPGCETVSADNIKEAHPSYDPDNAHKLHEYSVREAERQINQHSDNGLNIIFDSGSINNSYTKRIINNLKRKEYLIELIHIKTPLSVCLERNKTRTRKVPVDDMVIKAVKENAQFHKLKEMVASTIVVDYYTNKHIFIDMDGVIAALKMLPIINGEIDFVNGEVHKYAEPVYEVISKLKNLDGNHKLYIMSAIPNSVSYKEKNAWLDKHFPIPEENRYFANRGNMKGEMLENLQIKLKIKKKDMVLIDDTQDIVYSVLQRGMNAMHVSEFLTHKF